MPVFTHIQRTGLCTVKKGLHGSRVQYITGATLGVILNVYENGGYTGFHILYTETTLVP